MPVSAGLLIRESHQVQEQGGREGALPRPRLQNKEERSQLWRRAISWRLMAAVVPRMGSVVRPRWPRGRGRQAAQGSNWKRHAAYPPVLPRGMERGTGGNQSHTCGW